MHNAFMPNVMIRDLDPDVHAVLVARAEREGRSLQQYLTRELTRLVERPTAAELFTQIEARGDGIDLTTEQILDAIRRGREEQ
jgi:plasmid stability protein